MPYLQHDPFLEYRETPEFLVVLSLYEQLHDDFCREFGPEAAPEYSVSDSGERILNQLPLAVNPGMLLPVHGGWAYSPTWVAPSRLDMEPPNSVPDLQDETAAMLFVLGAIPVKEPSVVELPLIETRIYERAWRLALLHSADDILDRGIEQAQQSLEEATQDYISHSNKAADPGPRFKEHLLALYKSEKKLRLLRLRLHWLKLWNGIEAARKEKVRGLKTNRLTQIKSIIKPQDVFDAYETIELHLKNKDTTAKLLLNEASRMAEWLLAEYEHRGYKGRLPSRLLEELRLIRSDQPGLTDEQLRIRLNWVLGSWYKSTLQKCGASEEELQAILGNSSQKPGVNPRPRSWNHVVRKILSNYIQS